MQINRKLTVTQECLNMGLGLVERCLTKRSDQIPFDGEIRQGLPCRFFSLLHETQRLEYSHCLFRARDSH